MRIIDPHCHMYSRTVDDYEMMGLCGIEAVVEPSFWLGNDRQYAGSFFDYFNHISEWEPKNRALKHGMRHFCTIAMNPKEAENIALAREVIAGMGGGDPLTDGILASAEELLVLLEERAEIQARLALGAVDVVSCGSAADAARLRCHGLALRHRERAASKKSRETCPAPGRRPPFTELYGSCSETLTSNPTTKRTVLFVVPIDPWTARAYASRTTK